ncbi:uncharacterized protein LOC144335651 isoform X3 [Macaca mulatta]
MLSISHLSPRAWQIQSLSQNLKPSQVQREIPPVQTLCETPEVEACKPASAISDAQMGQVTSVLCLPPCFLLAGLLSLQCLSHPCNPDSTCRSSNKCHLWI